MLIFTRRGQGFGRSGSIDRRVEMILRIAVVQRSILPNRGIDIDVLNRLVADTCKYRSGPQERTFFAPHNPRV